jgi:raffinose/stachyose/melibiose transport system permease protein
VINNWPDTWKIGGYGIAYINSLITATLVIIIVLTIVGLGAYALSKLRFVGRDFFIAYFFVAISLPGFLYIVPDYFMFNRLHLINTRFALVLLYTAGQIPFNMLLLRTFLAGIPRELEEAAKIDGCNELSVFVRITVPIAKTIFLTIAILVFVGTWNEFLWANTFISDELLKPVSTRYVKFVGQYSSNMARIYTASAITILPIIVLYVLFSRRFIEGMTSGSVKG